MRFDTSQQMRIEQSMRMAPRIIQAMEILQLPIMALQERIEEEMQSNPVLEMKDSSASLESPDGEAGEAEASDRAEQPLVVRDEGSQSDDFRRLAEFEDAYGSDFVAEAPVRASAGQGEGDRKMDAMANAPAPPQSLNEYLLDQWSFVEVDAAIRRAGQSIIEHIEEDGYLRASLEQIAAESQPPTSLETLRAALRLVQSLEPAGVGARDLRECLLLQLAVEEAAGRDMSLEKTLAQSFLRDIEMNHLPQIARRTDTSLDRVKAAIETISRLNPRPGSLIGQRGAPVIAPDVVVDVSDDGEVIVSMPRGNSPRLLISKDYRKMVSDRKADRPTRQFIRNNIRSAQWLISAIEQRRATVRRVAEEVFKAQRAFLDDGSEALKPLPMAEVASKVGVHVATISRAVSGKYVQTPRGIFPLRMFFSGGTTTAEGQDVSWDAVKVKLKELVDGEDKRNPLNDDDLAKEMEKHGMKIARRTVVKYRKLLDVPPARKRKQY